MMFVSEDGNRIGFAAGERVELRLRIERVPGVAYQMSEGDVLTLVVRDGAGKNAKTVLEARGESGSNLIVISSEATAALKPGNYNGAVVLSGAEIGRAVVWPKCGEKELLAGDCFLPRGNVLVCRGW